MATITMTPKPGQWLNPEARAAASAHPRQIRVFGPEPDPHERQNRDQSEVGPAQAGRSAVLRAALTALDNASDHCHHPANREVRFWVFGPRHLSRQEAEWAFANHSPEVLYEVLAVLPKAEVAPAVKPTTAPSAHKRPWPTPLDMPATKPVRSSRGKGHETKRMWTPRPVARNGSPQGTPANNPELQGLVLEQQLEMWAERRREQLPGLTSVGIYMPMADADGATLPDGMALGFGYLIEKDRPQPDPFDMQQYDPDRWWRACDHNWLDGFHLVRL